MGLLKAYKKGDGRSAIALSGYFKQGVYFFPKDTTTAKELYSRGLARIDSVIKLKEENFINENQVTMKH